MKKENVRIGIAPIGWTNDDMPELGKDITFCQAIDEMAFAGFEGCEVGNSYPTNTEELRGELERRNLRIASRWFSSELLTKSYTAVEKDFDKVLDFLQSMGASCVNVCEVSYSTFDRWDKRVYGESYVMNDEEWVRFATGLNALGARAATRNIKLCYHHHLGAVVESAEETDRLMSMTDPDKVWLCFDTGHFLAVHADPVEMLKKHITRVGHVHLKDYRKYTYSQMLAEKKCFRDGVLAGMFTVPGDGDFDFTPIFQLLAEADYHGWLLVEAEQDPKKANPLDYARIARAYIAEKAGI